MTVKKRSIKIDGHTTSISLEDEFWDALKQLSEDKNISLAQLVSDIDTARPAAQGLSSALRVYILQQTQKKAARQDN